MGMYKRPSNFFRGNMLRFFRVIREQLIKQGKVRTYLLYALGEILLVVIGILIALQVNNWNEERKTIELKNNLLATVKSDLNKDIDQLQIVRSDLKNKDEYGMYLMGYFNSDKDASEFDISLLRRGFMDSNDIGEFFPVQLGYIELISTGAINRIEDDSLKQLLFDHYEISVRERGEFEQRDRYGKTFADARFEFIPNLTLREKAKSLFQQGDWKEDPYEDLNLDWDLIRSESDFPMYLGRLLAVQLVVIARLDETEKSMHQMIDRIDNEIEAK